jgi:hypothetical protein
MSGSAGFGHSMYSGPANWYLDSPFVAEKKSCEPLFHLDNKNGFSPMFRFLGYSFHILPSNSLPPDFEDKPPHRLKKNGICSLISLIHWSL